MAYFGESTPRIQRLREEILAAPLSICAQRAVLVTEAYSRYQQSPIILKRARSLDNVLCHMSIYIEDGQLLAGNQASRNRAAPVFPEYAMDWVLAELDEWEKRDGDRFLVSDHDKAAIRGIALAWEGKTLKEKALALMPAYIRLLYDIGLIKAEGNITSGDGHMTVNYEKLLKMGLSGIRAQAVRAKAALDLTDFVQFKKQYFFDAALIVIDACIAFAHRYADLARSLAAREGEEGRRLELLELSGICDRVPECPARTFHEAVQSVWLIHLVLQIESNGHSVSFGRLDQYLYPFYQSDTESGRINAERACEILECLWIKTLSINKIRSQSHTKFSAGCPLYQNVCIGGQDAQARDATNELSYLVLRAVGQLRLTQPNLSVSALYLRKTAKPPILRGYKNTI